MRHLRTTALVAVALGAAWRADAALGDRAASVDADARAVGAVRRATTDHRAYVVERLDTGSTSVREYVSAAGTVFAVAWDGLAQPDLGVLLGTHAEEYRKAAQRTKAVRARRSQRVAADAVVVETWGHARRLQGRAWLPSEIPSGVGVDDIR